jgi:hypothetical protein
VPEPGPIFLPVEARHVLLYFARLGLAAALGAVLGIDREKIQSAAGCARTSSSAWARPSWSSVAKPRDSLPTPRAA